MRKKRNEDSEYLFQSIDEILQLCENEEDLKRIFFELNDDELLGKATELLINFIVKNNYIYSTIDDTKEEMWIYEEGIYVPDAKTKIKNFIYKILGSFYKLQLANELIEKIRLKTLIDKNKFFNTNIKEEIPVKNGILNILTKELTSFTPLKIFFNKLPVFYDPQAQCPAIKQHFKDVLLSEEDHIAMFEFIGLLLYKEYFIEKAIMLVGNSRNGKGKTLELIKRFIGEDNCSSIPLANLTEDSFSVSQLFGKMVNIAGDLSYHDLKKTGYFKQTSGRDTIGAKRKFKSDLQFTNYAKHIFACNKLPKVYEDDEGFWNRWVLFEFPNQFIKEEEYLNLSPEQRKNKKILNPDHISKISTQEELNGLLNEALEGLNRLMINKDFSHTLGIQQTKMMWVRMSDSFKAFCMDNIEESPNTIIPKAIIRKAYFLYCKQHNLNGSSDKAIHIALEENYGVEDYHSFLQGERIWTWKGIDFKNDSPYKYLKGTFTFKITNETP